MASKSLHSNRNVHSLFVFDPYAESQRWKIIRVASTTSHPLEISREVKCGNIIGNQICGLLGMMQTYYFPQIKALYSCRELENAFLVKVSKSKQGLNVIIKPAVRCDSDRGRMTF